MTDNPVDEMTGVSTDVQVSPPEEALPSTSAPMALNDTITHDLTSVLERPVLLANGVWTTADNPVPWNLPRSEFPDGNPPFLEFNFPQDIMDKSLPIREKLGNFRYLRSDVEFELKVNANQFQQGSLLVVYNPYINYVNEFRKNATRFLPSLSSLPHAVLSLEETNSVKMLVPYANIYDYFDLGNDLSQFGTIQVYVLSQLRASSDAERVGFACFGRLVKPEWYTPTPLTQTTQHGVVRHVADYANTAEEAKTMISSLRSKFDLPMTAEMDEGSATGSVARIASNVIGKIPGVAQAAHALGWMSRAVSGVASALGFSKPTNTVVPQHVHNLPASYMAHGEGKDMSTTLGMIADNAISPEKVIPEPQDEMSLKYILQRPNMVVRYAVPAADFVANNLLFSFVVAPVQPNQKLGGTFEELFLGTFAYVSMLFRYWRGAIKFHMRVMKTLFHSGRFVVVYFPGAASNQIPNVLTDEITTCYNTIYDLKTLSSCEFVIPYISNEPWKRTCVTNSDNALQVQDPSVITGTVGVYALTDLIFPDTVSDTVDFVLEVSAGDDYELALPSLQMAVGYATEPPSDVNEFILQGDGATLKSAVAASAGDKVVLQLPDKQAISGAYFPGYIGLKRPGLSGTYTSSKMSVYVSQGGVQKTEALEGVFNLDFFQGVCIGCIFSKELLWTETSDLTDCTLTILTVGALFDKDTPMTAEGNENLLIPGNNTTSAISCTMGEYVLSLRTLLKRFTIVARLASGVLRSYGPNIARESPLNGARIVRSVSELVLPDTHYSLISNIYRFYAGGTRVKVFANSSDAAMTAGLVVEKNLDCAGFFPDITPVVEQHANVNNVLELTVPYYGQTRCQVLGTNDTELKPTARAAFRILSASSTESTIYEAGADDLSFFFLVGPPVMRYTGAGRVTPPLLQ